MCKNKKLIQPIGRTFIINQFLNLTDFIHSKLYIVYQNWQSLYSFGLLFGQFLYLMKAKGGVSERLRPEGSPERAKRRGKGDDFVGNKLKIWRGV